MHRPVARAAILATCFAAGPTFAAWPVNHLLLKHELKAGHRRPSDVFPFGSVLRFRVLAKNSREERSRCHQNHTI